MKSLVAKIVGAATSATHAAQLQQVARSTLGGAETVGTPSATTGSVTLDCSTGNVFPLTPTGNVTALTLSNPPATGISCRITLIVSQGGTLRTIAAPTGFKWMTQIPVGAINKTTVYEYHTVDGGTTWYCYGGVEI